ncbi:type IV pilus assembly protein PilM [Aeoliella sp.]|uniref:type IV pilus assembly protein PilM n=1 Tax=Aeoliella sp. TaxID=2795800 RepID=UPI003CCC0E5E
MAKSGAVWGIDIGNCALKALQCRRHEKDTNRIVVEAFDFVEYSKILTQPEADREALIAEAVATFVSRNELKGDRVAVSVPGQSGLSRFIKLPPVEAKKIPDIVKYEAKQQIPFALEDVVWDYQQLAGGNQEEGYAIDPEVGLFAMKRDQVHRAIRPLTDAGLEVDYIQLAPLAIYNYACFDRMNNLEDAPPFDPDNPAKSLLVLSFGTETTDLVITNGYRVWQRNIPIGGSHFTRALTKEMQLTFTKAEHLKRNATKAEDPKALFQAMRPVFSDLVAEIQRSIGFFMNNNKKAEIGDIVALGNPMRLPGLQRYLSQNLDQKVVLLEEFPGLVGGSVTAAPQFQANHLSFAEAYGLCVQGLGLGQLETNLLPQEIVTERLVQSKKPWTVAAAAVLMLGLTVNYFSHSNTYKSADVENGEMATALQNASSKATSFNGEVGRLQGLVSQFDQLQTIRTNLRSNDDGRLMWLELLKAIDSALPQDPTPIAERELSEDAVRNREELHIESIDCEFFPDVSIWYTEVEQALKEAAGVVVAAEEPAADATAEGEEGEAAADGTEAADGVAAAEPAPEDAVVDEEVFDQALDEFAGLEGEAEPVPPSGEGWIIQITGYHYHNSDRNNPGDFDREDEAGRFVYRTLIESLRNGTIMLPSSEPGNPLKEYSMEELGISKPVMVSNFRPVEVAFDPEATTAEEASRRQSEYRNSLTDEGGGPAWGGASNRQTADGPEVPKPEVWNLRRYEFQVQFIWQPKPRTIRDDPEQAPQGIDDTGGV